ncbi:MAG: hypothetical protein ACR2PA_04250 [Hyphomicrobiaceae bacterium]
MQEIAARSARQFIAFDMERLAREAGTVISASLFGALAGSGVLPFSRESYTQTIREGGRGAEASLKAFDAAFDLSGPAGATGGHRVRVCGSTTATSRG